MVPGVYASVPVVSAWMSNNSEPYFRRASSIAIGFVATNSVYSSPLAFNAISLIRTLQGGILSTWRYPTKEGPKFRNTMIMNLVFSILVVVGSLVNMAYLNWKNRQKQRPRYREEVLAKYYSAGGTEEDANLRAWMELGDRHPDYRYTL